MEYEIYCPYHLGNEKLVLPDEKRWEGQINCTGAPPRPLKITVIHGMLAHTDAVEHPDWEPPRPLY